MILTSRHTSAAIPDCSVVTFVRDALAGYGDRVAIVDGPTGRSYTFRQVLDLSSSIAHGLRDRGIATGDRVAFVVPNLPEVALAYHGTLAAGAVAMMLNPLSTPEELAKYFEIGTPRLAVTVPRLAVTVPQLVPALRAAAPELATRAVAGGRRLPSAAGRSGPIAALPGRRHAGRRSADRWAIHRR